MSSYLFHCCGDLCGDGRGLRAKIGQNDRNMTTNVHPCDSPTLELNVLGDGRSSVQRDDTPVVVAYRRPGRTRRRVREVSQVPRRRRAHEVVAYRVLLCISAGMLDDVHSNRSRSEEHTSEL